MATYRLPAAAGSGYTLLGSATVIAKISSPTANSEMAARLLDVDPNGTETLVARQLFRPQVGTARQVFQLHPSGHLFAPGHVAKLELLPSDAGGNDAQQLRARRERPGGHHGFEASTCACRCSTDPGAAGGQVTAAPALPLPCGMAIAPQFSSDSYLRATLGDGKLRFKGRTGKVPVDSAPGLNPCQVQIKLLGSGKASGRSAKKQKKNAKVLGRGGAKIPGGQSATREAEAQQAGRGRGPAWSRDHGPGDHGGPDRATRCRPPRSTSRKASTRSTISGQGAQVILPV